MLATSGLQKSTLVGGEERESFLRRSPTAMSCFVRRFRMKEGGGDVMKSVLSFMLILALALAVVAPAAAAQEASAAHVPESTLVSAAAVAPVGSLVTLAQRSLGSVGRPSFTKAALIAVAVVAVVVVYAYTHAHN